jgi:hypothetical protein
VLTVATLEARYLDFFGANRQSMVDQLAARGVPEPEAIADRIIAETARAVAPGVLDKLRENLRRSYADSAAWVDMMLSPENTPEDQPRADFIAAALARRAKAKYWLDYQVAAAIQRMNADDLNIQPQP